MRSFIQFIKGIVLRGEATDLTDNTPGSLWQNSTTGRLKGYFGGAVREMVSTDQTQTLTNKSIDGGSNTLTNIPGTAVTNIPRSSIAAGTPSQIVVNDGSGNLSSEALITKAQGGTGADNSAVTFPTTGTVVTEAGTETLTNKTLTSPVITTPTGIVKGDVGLANVDNTSDATKNSATATLTNKSLVDASTAIVDSTDATKTIKFDAGGTTATGTTLAAAQTANRTVTLPDATDTLVGRATTDTLTNKTLTAPVISTISNTGTLTLPTATDTLVGRATTDTLTNKTISGSNNTITNIPLATAVSGTLPIANGGTGQTSKSFAFDALSPTTTNGDLIYGYSGTNVRLPVGSANQVLKSVSGVPTWASVNLSGINYVSANPDAEVDTSGWATYVNTAQTAPTSGIGGTPNVTWTRTTSNPLRGTGSFLFTKDAVNRQGQGVSFLACTTDTADQGKVLSIQADYQIASGTYADGDLGIYMFDITNGVVIYPSVSNINNIGLYGKLNATFQTNTNSVSYRLIVHVQSTSANAYTVKFDNWSVGPQTLTTGPAMTDWKPFTPTGTWTTNSTYTGQWRRVGDSAEVMFNVALSGAPNATALQFAFPASIGVVDSTKLIGGSFNSLATASGNRGGTGIALLPFWLGPSTVGVYFDTSTSTGVVTGVTSTAPVTWASGDAIAVSIHVPITGWSSGSLLSSDAGDNRIITAQLTYNSQAATANVPMTVSSTGFDSTGAVTTGAQGYFKAPIAGYYTMSGIATRPTGTGNTLNYFINGSVGGTLTAITFAGGSIPFSSQVYLNAGDKLNIAVDGSFTISATFNVTRVSTGNQQIAATETIAAHYNTSASQSIPTGSFTQIVFGTKVYDTHNTFNASTGAYTVPANGLYSIKTTASLITTTNSGEILISIYKNSNPYESGTRIPITAAGSTLYYVSANTDIRLNAGDVITIGLYQTNGGSRSMEASGVSNYVAINRVGN